MTGRKLTASILTFLLILQTIIGVFTPINVSVTPPYISLQETNAAASTWTGTVSMDWGTAGNWSLALVPDSTTDVIIPDATTTTYDPAISVGAVSGSVTIQANGILNGNANTITIYGDWTNAGTFNHGSGTVVFTGNDTSTFTSGSSAYNNIEVNMTYSSWGDDDLYISGTATVSGNLTHTNGGLVNGQINLAGNYIIGAAATGTYRYGTSTIINFNHATNDQTITYNAGGIGAHVRIDKAGGIFSITDTIPLSSWTYVAGTVTGLDTYTLTLKDDSSGIFTPGSFIYNNVEINRTGTWEDLTISGTATVSGNLAHINGELNSGQINLAGNYIVGAAATGAPYGHGDTPTIINFNHATNDQTITYNAGGIGAHVCIDKAGGIFSITSDVTVNGWTHTAGTVTGLDTYTLTFKDDTNGSFTHGSLTYGNIEINRTSSNTGYDDLYISSGTLDINGNLTITDGDIRLNTNNPNINIAGNFSIASIATFTKGTGTLTFDGTSAATFTDSSVTPQDIGNVVINKTNAIEANNKFTLASDMTVDTLTIDGTANQSDILDLGLSGYILNIANSASIADVFIVAGTLTPGTSTVKYSATNSTGNISIAAAAYDSLQLSGSETYDLAGNLTNSNALTGNITIDASSTLNTTATNYNITLAGDWSNSNTFTANSSTVTLNGSSQSITGSTIFYNFTKSVTSADTLTFDNTATQTITNILTLNGAAGQLLSLRSNLTSNQWETNPQGTRTIDYLDIKDSNNIDAVAMNARGLNFADSGNNTNWTFNTSPNIPTLVSPVNDLNTSDNTPALSANYSDPDSGDTGTTNYRISSSSLSDCIDPVGINIIASGTSSITSDNNEDTTWTSGSSIGSDGTYYWCAQNNDGTAISSWTQMGSFVLDTTGPIISLSSPANDASTIDNQPTLTWSASDATSGIAKYQLYVDSVLDTDNISNSATSVVTANELTCGFHTWYVRAYDNVNNYTDSSVFNLTMSCGGGLPPSASNPPALPEPDSENPEGGFSVTILRQAQDDNNNTTVKLKLYAGADTKRMAISNTEDFEYASQVSYQEEIEWELSACGAGSFDSFLAQDDSSICTVYAKFYTRYGVASEIVSDSIILKTAVAETEEQSDDSDQDKPESETEDDKSSKDSESDKTNPSQSTAFTFTKTLKFGSNNNQVTQLQNKLKELNFFPKEIKSNGNFGPATEQAVKEYQESKGIYPCGIVGPRTRKVLNNEELITNKDYKFTQDLKYNDKNEEVKQLQIRLQDQNFFPYNVKPTGWFGSITKKAVNIFQKFYNLIQSGVVDEGMREVLNK